MTIRATPGSVSTAIGLLGSGVALAFPDARWIGGAMIALGAMWFLLGLRVDTVGFHTSLRSGWRARLNPYLLIAGLLSHWRGPMAWEESTHSPLAFDGDGSDQSVNVIAFTIRGRNISKDATVLERPQVRSAITAQVEFLEVQNGAGGLSPADRVVVPPNGEITLMAWVPSVDRRRTHGRTVMLFRESWAAFTFSYQYDGKNFSKRYSERQVDRILRRGERVNRAAMMRLPGRPPGR